MVLKIKQRFYWKEQWSSCTECSTLFIAFEPLDFLVKDTLKSNGIKRTMRFSVFIEVSLESVALCMMWCMWMWIKNTTKCIVLIELNRTEVKERARENERKKPKKTEKKRVQQCVLVLLKLKVNKIILLQQCCFCCCLCRCMLPVINSAWFIDLCWSAWWAACLAAFLYAYAKSVVCSNVNSFIGSLFFRSVLFIHKSNRGKRRRQRNGIDDKALPFMKNLWLNILAPRQPHTN